MHIQLQKIPASYQTIKEYPFYYKVLEEKEPDLLEEQHREPIPKRKYCIYTIIATGKQILYCMRYATCYNFIRRVTKKISIEKLVYIGSVVNVKF